MRVLLIGADREEAGLVAQELEEHGHYVDKVFESSTGRFLLEKTGYGLLVVYHHPPEIDGAAICREARACHLTTIMMMLAFPGECSVIDAFSAGADSYLALPAEAGEIIARLKAIARRARRPVPSAGRLKAGDIVMDLDSKAVIRRGRPIEVTASEFRILEFLMQHKNCVLSREEIAGGIWGAGMADKARAVPVHMNNLRGKLTDGLDGPTGIYTVSGRGYLMVDKDG